MAKAQQKSDSQATPASLLVPLEFTLNPAQMAYLASMVPNSDDTDFRKVQAVITHLVEDQAAGGLMLKVQEVKLITDSTGLDPSCGADLMPFLQAGTGRADGCRTVTVRVDPAYEEAIGEVARVRGVTIEDILRDTMQVAFDNEWYEHLPWQPERVLMTKEDQRGLEELLGGKFATGTELAALIRKQLEGGLFSEPDHTPAGAVQ